MLRRGAFDAKIQSVGFRESEKNAGITCILELWTVGSDSCARVTPYCSVLAVGYDISCGSFDPLVLVVLRKRPDALFASGEG